MKNTSYPYYRRGSHVLSTDYEISDLLMEIGYTVIADIFGKKLDFKT